MALWKYAATAMVSAFVGASVAIGSVYFAADSLVGDRIDHRVSQEVSDEVDAAIIREREHTTTPALQEAFDLINSRFDRIESRRYRLEIGLDDCGTASSLDEPYGLTRLGEAELICIVE